MSIKFCNSLIGVTIKLAIMFLSPNYISLMIRESGFLYLC